MRKTDDGEWKTERGPFGGVRRYRETPFGREYELEIGGVPQSVFLESNRRREEQQRAEFAAAQRKAALIAAQRRNCPFSDGMQTDCKREACALFMDGCTLARLTAAADTQGKQCPLNRYRQKCRTDCALYKGGCTLTGIKTNTESEDK